MRQHTSGEENRQYDTMRQLGRLEITLRTPRNQRHAAVNHMRSILTPIQAFFMP